MRNHSGSDQVAANPAVTQITGEKWMSSEKMEEEWTKISGKLILVRTDLTLGSRKRLGMLYTPEVYS